MGPYLSTPVSEVSTKVGTGDNGIKYVVGEMQGWRRDMEDAAITYPDVAEFLAENQENFTDIKLPPDAKSVSLFGVFDGHGGIHIPGK